MLSMPSSPLISVGRLIDESWDLYRARFHELMSVSGWLLWLAILYTLSLSLYPSASTLWLSNELTWSQYLGVILFFLTNYVIGPLLGIWVLIGLVRLLRMQLAGRKADVKKAIAEIKPLFFPTILVSIMVGFLLVVATLIGVGPGLIIGVLGAVFGSLTLVGLADFLLVIGVFVALGLSFKWMVEYMLAPYAIMSDGLRGKKALAAGRSFVKGRFWSVFLRLLVPKFVFLLIGVILMGIVTYITGILLSAAGGLNLDLQLRLTTLVEWTVPVVIAVLINPLVIIADVLLYRSLKGDSSL